MKFFLYVLAMVTLNTIPSNVAAKTLIYDFSAPIGGTSDVAKFKFQLDFDFLASVEDSTVGFTILDSNLVSDTEIVYSYRHPNTPIYQTDYISRLAIGGVIEGGCCVRENGQRDFVIYIINPQYVNARPHTFFVSEGTQPFHYTLGADITLVITGDLDPLPPIITPPTYVPLPATFPLTLAGLAGIGWLRRRN